MLNGLLNVDETALSVMRKIGDLMKSAKADSLVDYAKNTRVEPIVVLDRGLISYPDTNQVMQSLTNLFAAYYLQAIAVSMSIGNIEINSHLEKFNPNRNVKDNLIDGAGTLLALEAQRMVNFKSIDLQAKPFKNDSAEDRAESGADTNANSRHFQELADLSVGKLITVELTDGYKKASVPISIRLIATESTPENIVNILSTSADLKSFKERFEGLRMGRLSFWRDIVMAQDLIDTHKARLMGDTTGVYNNARTRANRNFWSSVLSLNPSVATASNIFIMSGTTAHKLEGVCSAKLKDFKQREKIFAQMYVMFLVVVDTEWDRVTIYTRGIPEANTLGISGLKSANKGSGPSISEILSAYQLGKAPNL